MLWDRRGYSAQRERLTDSLADGMVVVRVGVVGQHAWLVRLDELGVLAAQLGERRELLWLYVVGGDED